MTNDDLEQRLRAWYLVDIDERAGAPVQLRTENATLAQAAAGSQRRFLARWSFPRMTRAVPFAIAAAAVVVTLAIGVGLLLRPPSDVAPPASLTPAPSVTPSPTATLAATPEPQGPLGGGLMLVTTAKPDPDKGTFDVFTLDAGTGEQTLLGTLPRTSFGHYDFQWGADRKHVLITASSGSGPVALENQTEAARDLIMVCCEPLPDGAVLSLSPQSDRIAASTQGDFAIPGCLLCADVPAAVVVVDVGGGNKRTTPLPDGTIGGGSVSWSPDGSAVVVLGCQPCNIAGAIASAAGGSGGDWAKLKPTAVEHAHVFIVPVDGSPVRKLLDAKEATFGSAAWSPDGTTIAFLRNTCPALEHAPYCAEHGTVQLVTMTVADSQLTVLADMADDFAWSPDGRRLTFGNANGLFVMDADGSHLAKVAEGNPTKPRWSPDGTWLVFSTYDEALNSFAGPWIVPADGGEPRLLGAYGGWTW